MKLGAKNILIVTNRPAIANSWYQDYEAFEKQVYGCAPTEIIYRICLRYILGFSDEIHVEKNNIRLCDTLKYAKDGSLVDEMHKLFGL